MNQPGRWAARLFGVLGLALLVWHGWSSDIW